jgi:hypothetical protein
MSEKYEIIKDEEELKWFFDNIAPPLENDEVYFVSLSARSKLLTEKEKVMLNLGRTEMFSRSIIREKEWDRFLRTIKKYEVSFGAYTTKNGSEIPNRAIVVYFNINPSSTLKAYKEFNKTMNEYMFELSTCSMTGRDTSDIMHRIKKLDVLLMNCYQKNRGTKHWMDFDFDVPKIKVVLDNIEDLVSEIEKRGGRAYIIETQGGYHVLVSTDTQFDESFNPQTIIETYGREIAYDITYGEQGNIKTLGYEVIHNSNAMIPLPGTFHNNMTARVINK